MARTKRKLHICRLFALALCLLLAFSVLPGRAYALSGTTGELKWSLSGGTLRVSGSGAMPNYSDGNMAPWYGSAQAINRIIVEDGVTSVGSLAFYGCSTAVQVSLPSSVETVGDRAFKNCTALTYVSLPRGLTAIGKAAFESCTSLNGIILPESLRTVESNAFERCTSLTGIAIPAGVTRLGMLVFYNCTALTYAEIRCPIEKLPEWFFYGCTNLTAVELPKAVEEIGEQAFHQCENLSTVYYSGEAAAEIEQTLQGDDATRFAVVTDNGETTEMPTVGVTTFDEQTATATNTVVQQTGQSVITQVTQTTYSYTVDGEPATVEEALNATETGNVEVTKEANTVITATVYDSDGWDIVTEAARDAAVQRSDSGPVEITVRIDGSTVSGKDVSGLVGVDAELKISTDEGCCWVIDTKQQRRKDFSNALDLSFETELLESTVQGIQSDTVYHVKFASDIGFGAKVGVSLKVGDALQSATIYEKSGGGLVELCSAVVDESGCAWFPVSQVSQGKDYYVGINVVGADTANAIVPDSMVKDYGVDYLETLTDASGKQYEVGERESRWGITGKQFTVYVVIGLGVLVLITSGAMITFNKISRSKARYTVADAADDYEIDEEALRLQIMQEMLEEARQKKGD